MASIPSPPYGVPSTPTSRAPYVPPRPRPGTGTHVTRDSELDRVRTIARVMDTFFLDPILGFIIPGGGDILGSLLGVYTVMIAARRKVSPVIIARMLMNLAGDAILGLIPFLGDIADIGFKANQRNIALLDDRWAHQGGRATARDWLILVGAICAFLGAIALVIYGVVALVRWIA